MRGSITRVCIGDVGPDGRGGWFLPIYDPASFGARLGAVGRTGFLHVSSENLHGVLIEPKMNNMAEPSVLRINTQRHSEGETERTSVHRPPQQYTSLLFSLLDTSPQGD
jgi:hypothetical protein